MNGENLLARLNALPMSTWNYKAQDSRFRHLGPMAQDFYGAFGLGEDDKHIDDIDGQGVALAGVQALYRLSLKKDAEIQKQQAQIGKLKAENSYYWHIHVRLYAAAGPTELVSTSARVIP